MVSQETPTPEPKRRKVSHAKQGEIAKVSGGLKTGFGIVSSENLKTGPGLVNQSAADLFPANRSLEESRPLATAKEKETDVEDDSGSGSEVDDMDLGDFDTEGITREELKLWSRCAPEDQKLGVKIEDSPVGKSALKVRFSSM